MFWDKCLVRGEWKCFIASDSTSNGNSHGSDLHSRNCLWTFSGFTFKVQFSNKKSIEFFLSKVANYGIGGLYKTHTDSTVNREDTDPWMLHIGDRIATLMVYVIWCDCFDQLHQNKNPFYKYVANGCGSWWSNCFPKRWSYLLATKGIGRLLVEFVQERRAGSHHGTTYGLIVLPSP